jgi:hypothetical protein
MRRKSPRALKSATLMTKPEKAPTVGAWAGLGVTATVIGTGSPVPDIGTALIRNGVSRLYLYDPTPVAHSRFAAFLPYSYGAGAHAKLLAQVSGNPHTQIIGHPFAFCAEIALTFDLAILINPDSCLCAFCNNYFEASQTPYVVVTMAPYGDEGTVLVHQVQVHLTGLATDEYTHHWQRTSLPPDQECLH